MSITALTSYNHRVRKEILVQQQFLLEIEESFALPDLSGEGVFVSRRDRGVNVGFTPKVGAKNTNNHSVLRAIKYRTKDNRNRHLVESL